MTPPPIPEADRLGPVASSHKALVDKVAQILAQRDEALAALEAAQARATAVEAENRRLSGTLKDAHRGIVAIHNGLADPTRPRQSVGEVAAYWVERIGAALSQPEATDAQT